MYNVTICTVTNDVSQTMSATYTNTEKWKLELIVRDLAAGLQRGCDAVTVTAHDDKKEIVCQVVLRR
jgi:hypothetical protein